MSEQYPLDLPYETSYGAGAFLAASSNLDIRALVERWRDWPNRAAAIWGPPGAGKSHLGHVWRAAVDATTLDLSAFDALDLGALEPPCRYVLDLGEAAFPQTSETQLFHLLNLVRERSGALLIVARAAPARWPVGLPDLASRLRALPAAGAAAPDDELFTAVLDKQFKDRQLDVDEATLGYLVTRSERSFEAARILVNRLDRAGLAKRRAITIKLCHEVLAEIEAEGL
ncbi:MAG: HdaA/DnaA family protein [Alphaproteobacteria bacterium]